MFNVFSLSHVQHLFKLVWNRKRSNMLMVLEIFAAFLVLYCVTTAILQYISNAQKPLGYSYKGVWNVSASRKETSPYTDNASRFEAAQRLTNTLKQLPQVESVSFITNTPFSNSEWQTEIERGGVKSHISQSKTTDELDKTLGLKLVQGRWFDATDDIANGTNATVVPGIINSMAAATFFGTENPVGKMLREPGKYDDGEPRSGIRVVGVIEAYRKSGEFAVPGNVLFQRISLRDTTADLPYHLVIKMRDGVNADFEEPLLKIMQQQASDWDFQITTLEQDRTQKHQMFLIPLGVGLTVAAFLLITVGLGLVGVVWQSVTRRMRELGVRRAFGATRSDIIFFVLGEIFVLTTFSVVLGLLVLAQFPVVVGFSIVSPQVYGLSMILSVGAMFVMTSLCALYPSRIAAVVQPSEALRYE
jgi:putative ABC transport system permease protein